MRRGQEETGFGKWGKKRMWHFLGMREPTATGSAETEGERRGCACVCNPAQLSASTALLPGPGDRFPHGTAGVFWELWVSQRGSRDGQLYTAGWESIEKSNSQPKHTYLTLVFHDFHPRTGELSEGTPR